MAKKADSVAGDAPILRGRTWSVCCLFLAAALLAQAPALADTASILCSAFVVSPSDLDGDPHNEYALLPNDGIAHAVTFEVTVSNACNVPLAGVTITAPALSALGCPPLPGPFSLPAGASMHFSLCTAPRSCSGTNDPFTVITATASVDPASGSSPLTVSSDGIALVECLNADPFVRCGECPTAVARTPVGCGFPGSAVVIAQNTSTGCVTLDGSQSSDPDGDPLTYLWLADLDHDGQKEPIATGAVATACLPTGEHVITLVVDDGRCSTNASTSVVIISPSEAVEAIIAAVDRADLDRKNKRPLIVSLKAAEASLDRDDCGSGVNQLGAFLHKVNAQVQRLNPTAAAAFTALAQKVIDCIRCEKRNEH